MQKEIRVIVAVNDNKHAELIKEDIEKIIKTRSTIYFITDPEETTKFVLDYAIEKFPEYFPDKTKKEE